MSSGCLPSPAHAHSTPQMMCDGYTGARSTGNMRDRTMYLSITGTHHPPMVKPLGQRSLVAVFRPSIKRSGERRGRTGASRGEAWRLAVSQPCTQLAAAPTAHRTCSQRHIDAAQAPSPSARSPRAHTRPSSESNPAPQCPLSPAQSSPAHTAPRVTPTTQRRRPTDAHFRLGPSAHMFRQRIPGSEGRGGCSVAARRGSYDTIRRIRASSRPDDTFHDDRVIYRKGQRCALFRHSFGLSRREDERFRLVEWNSD